MKKTVVALFDEFEDARAAVEDLQRRGFEQENISLVANDLRGEFGHLHRDTRRLNREAYADREISGLDDYVGYDADAAIVDEKEGKRDHVTSGAAAGGILGGLTGLMMGIGSFAIPGIGPVIAAGPLIATLAGAGIGAVTGGLLGALVDSGVPDEHAGFYAEGVRGGGTLLTLTTSEERAADAVEALNAHNPVDIERRSGGWQAEGWEEHRPEAEPYTTEDLERERGEEAESRQERGRVGVYEPSSREE